MICRSLLRGVWLSAIVGTTIGSAIGVVKGQTAIGPVVVTAQVSGTVSLAPSPNFSSEDIGFVSGTSNTLNLALSGSDAQAMSRQLPIMVRSNTGFTIGALVRSQNGARVHVSVVGVRSTGRFTDPGAAEKLKLNPDLANRAESKSVTTDFPDGQFSILSCPRISLAGTLSSPDNALEVTLLIVVTPEPASKAWNVELTLTGNPASSY